MSENGNAVEAIKREIVQAASKQKNMVAEHTALKQRVKQLEQGIEAAGGAVVALQKVLGELDPEAVKSLGLPIPEDVPKKESDDDDGT